MAFRVSTQHTTNCIPLPSLLPSFILKLVPNSFWLFHSIYVHFKRMTIFHDYSYYLFVKYNSKVISNFKQWYHIWGGKKEHAVLSPLKESQSYDVYFQVYSFTSIINYKIDIGITQHFNSIFLWIWHYLYSYAH